MNLYDASITASDHMKHLLDPQARAASISEAVSALSGVAFDTIVFCGMSGALSGPCIADRLVKQMVMVRKESDMVGVACGGSHSNLRAEGFVDVERYVVIDDLVASGETLFRIFQQVHKFSARQKYRHLKIESPICIGVFHTFTRRYSSLECSVQSVWKSTADLMWDRHRAEIARQKREESVDKPDSSVLESGYKVEYVLEGL